MQKVSKRKMVAGYYIVLYNKYYPYYSFRYIVEDKKWKRNKTSN